ncbi:MAG: hypothetical protein Q9169_000001 [Polycauliona sp. 2 TL-2023]
MRRRSSQYCLDPAKNRKLAMEEGKPLPQSDVREISNERKKPGFGAKLKAHFRRFWWLHLILFIASILIIVLCIVYVAFPRIAQDGINDSTLEIQSLTLSNPTPTSFHLKQTAKLTNPSRYQPHLDAFNVSLSVGGGDGDEEDKPYAYIELPKVHATKTAYTDIDQEVQITDMDAFIEYNKQLLMNEKVDMLIKGRTKLHEGRLPATMVDYEKTITMKGLNSLTGFSIPTFRILLTPDPTTGANMLGRVLIPNPSSLTLTLGNVTLNNYVDGTFIGTSLLPDLKLVPGDNDVEMQSTVNQTSVIESVVGRYRDGMLPVEIVGEKVVNGVGERLGYFEEALRGVRLQVVLDVGKALGEVGAGGLVGGGGEE